MDFEERLRKAIDRGKAKADEKAREEAARQMNEEDYKRLHSKLRLQLSEHIEKCVEGLPNFFPGFRYETTFGDRGWGAACWRDDLTIGSGGDRQNAYSRLEINVRPYSPYHVLESSAKGTINNKEMFQRNYFERVDDADIDQFVELVNRWVLEYAELYAAQQ
ncbi:hypothetical protein [Lignipirellula cremea]|uniref:Uncharacterized protein n=1 Tax=Lignipirellula cremea TaxID=2528010 RepID=A0A518DLW4_9BACT|nr:hypothetical protein [Lignipirellula cremea]QDU92813.1 hypothetical protein Pla8534_05860 [Lignipirellula cremea]